MDDDLSTKTALFYDQGQYQEFAIRLARDFGRVLYYRPWKSATPSFRPLIIGDGFSEIRRVRDFFDYVDEADLIVFPDVYDGDLQVYLEGLGKRVWGSRKAERLEFRRSLFKRTLEELGLPVPEWHEIHGMTQLRDFLEEHADEEWIVKRDLLRGDGETFAIDNLRLTRFVLDSMDNHYGAAKELPVFVVEKKIETDIEVGYDGFSIDGNYTDGFVDYEIKNQACIASFTPYSEMNEHVRLINESFAPKLSDYRCRSMWGTEIRVDKKGDPYFIDATARTPEPPGSLMLEQISNISRIVWEGAMGNFVQAEPEKSFGVEIMVYADWQEMSLLPIYVPPEISRWVKVQSACKIDGVHHVIQCCGAEQIPWMREEVALVLGIGDTVEDAIEEARSHAALVEGVNIDVTEDALVEALSRIREGEKQGVEFSDEPVPEPSSIIEDK